MSARHNSEQSVSGFLANLTISRAVSGFGTAMIVALALIAAASSIALSELKVGGSSYERIIAGKDLVADILPPPLYVVEAYLEAEQVVDDTSSLKTHKARLAKLHDEYSARKKHWSAAAIPDAFKRALNERSDAIVARIWNDIEGQILPAIERKDDAAARTALEALTHTFSEHRAIIMELSEQANKYLAETEAAAATKSIWYQGLLFGLVALVFGVVLAMIGGMKRKVILPLKSMTSLMGTLAAGRYEIEIDHRDGRDEIGEMAQSLVALRDAGRNKIRLEKEAEETWFRSDAERKVRDDEQATAVRVVGEGLDRLAGGDLTVRIDTKVADAYAKLIADFNATVARLKETVTLVQQTTGSISSGADEISEAASHLSQRTESQAASLEETAAALDEITATVSKTAEGSDQARKLVISAKANAEKGGEVVHKAVTAMDAIVKSSTQIGQIIGVIDEIAFQTNLLALNAGVEAARVGDASRGFAVVASEVRALAQRSAEAAKEIKTLITASSAHVQQGVGLVAETGKSLERIVGEVKEIAAVVANIASGTQEQALGLQQVNTAVNQLDQMTQQNAAMAEEATAASRSLSKESAELVLLMGQFKLAQQANVHALHREAPRAIVKPKRSIAKPAMRQSSSLALKASEPDHADWKDF